MSKYTEETLDKRLKKGLISIVLPQQAEMGAANSKIMDQIPKSNENLEKFQSEVTVVKQVNSVLSERLSPWSVSAGQMPSTLDVSV